MTTRKLISDDGVFRIYEVFDDDGNVIGTDEEPVTPPALDALGVAMTLLATKGILTTQEAATACGRQPSDLVAEAEAWAVAAEIAAAPKR